MAAAGGHEFLVGGALVLLVDVLWTSSNYLASSVLYAGLLMAGRTATISHSP